MEKSNFTLLEAEEVKVPKDRSLIGKPFQKYQEVVKKINLVEWAKQEIDKRPEKIIVVKVTDLAKEMGPDFEKVKTTTLYSALRYILFYNDLTIGLGHHKDGDEVFTIKQKEKGDVLPQTYKDLEERAEKTILERQITETKKLTRIEEKRQKLSNEKSAVLDIEKEKDLMREKMRNEKKSMLEELEKERSEINKEKIEMIQEIDDLKRIITDQYGENIFLVEIFQFNWKTLSWKLIKRKSAKTYPVLFKLISDYVSSVEDRYRFEFTSIRESKEQKEEKQPTEEKGPEEITEEMAKGEEKPGEEEIKEKEKVPEEMAKEEEKRQGEEEAPKGEEMQDIHVQYAAEEEKVQYAPGEQEQKKEEEVIEKQEQKKEEEVIEKQEKETEVQEKTKETEVQEKTKETEVQEKTKETEVQEKTKETEVQEKTIEKQERDVTEPVPSSGAIFCPRCGSKNIKTWPTVQIIRTRSGERKLRHRCQDCNETFGDEDIPTVSQ